MDDGADPEGQELTREARFLESLVETMGSIAGGADVLERTRQEAERLFTNSTLRASSTEMVGVYGIEHWLDGKLKELIATGAINKAILKIEGDSDLRQEYIMRVYDTCKKAGFDKIHFVPPPVLNSRMK